MISARLRRRAYRQAAGELVMACDSMDLGRGLNESEENEVREFIRTKIVKALLRHGKEPKS